MAHGHLLFVNNYVEERGGWEKKKELVTCAAGGRGEGNWEPMKRLQREPTDTDFSWMIDDHSGHRDALAVTAHDGHNNPRYVPGSSAPLRM
jgi:hypothetical protein